MAKRLSQQLADLSVRAKNAEDAMAAAEKEAHDKIEARKEKTRAAAEKAAEKVKEEIKSVADTAARNWTAVRAKVAADIDGLKAGVAQAR
jgi:fibrillarin-like rRNA methylase